MSEQRVARDSALKKAGLSKPPPESSYRTEGKSRDLALAQVGRADNAPLDFPGKIVERTL